MNPESVLQRLDELGVKLGVDGIEVYVDCVEKVPPDLWQELSRSKLDLFVMIMSQRMLSECHTEQQLIARLRKGHDWITDSATQLIEIPGHCEGTNRLPRTMRWSRVWLLMERHLREAYRFEGCVLLSQPCTARRGLECTHCKELRN